MTVTYDLCIQPCVDATTTHGCESLLGARLGWLTTTLPQSRKVTSTVDKREDENLIGCDLIDESIAPDEELTNVRCIDFRYHPTTLSKSPQRTGC